MIETQSGSCEGWFPRGDTEKWLLGNHPPRDPLCDPAALLTQEGSAFSLFVRILLYKSPGHRAA